MFQRRLAEERRAGKDRRRADRRNAEIRHLVVELAEDHLHAALCVQSPYGDAARLDASKAPWRREANSLASSEGIAELASALRDSAKRLGQPAGGVFIVLGSEFCVSRVLRGTPEQVRNELKQIEQRSRLYLSLGPGPKAVVSHVSDVEARRQYAQALVCNQEVLDAIQRAVELAGLSLTGIEASLTAVNRALARVEDAPDVPALFVQARDRLAAIGIFHRGRLLLDYRPGSQTAPREAAARLAAHRNRLERHVARQVESAVELVDVYLESNCTAAESLRAEFEAYPQFRVHCVAASQVRGSWKFAPGAEQTVTLALMGGVLGRLTPPGGGDAPDLREHILQRTREPIRPILLRSLAPVAATLLVACLLGAANFRYAGQASVLQGQLALLSAAQTRAREVQLQYRGTDDKLRELRKLSEQLSGQTGGRLVRQLGGCLPNDVWLERLELSDASRVALKGASFLEAGVYDFVRWLEAAPLVAEAALKATSPSNSATGPLTNFDVELTLAAESRSAFSGKAKP